MCILALKTGKVHKQCSAEKCSVVRRCYKWGLTIRVMERKLIFTRNIQRHRPRAAPRIRVTLHAIKLCIVSCCFELVLSNVTRTLFKIKSTFPKGNTIPYPGRWLNIYTWEGWFAERRELHIVSIKGGWIPSVSVFEPVLPQKYIF